MGAPQRLGEDGESDVELVGSVTDGLGVAGEVQGVAHPVGLPLLAGVVDRRVVLGARLVHVDASSLAERVAVGVDPLDEERLARGVRGDVEHDSAKVLDRLVLLQRALVALPEDRVCVVKPCCPTGRVPPRPD
eukprot:766762-Hanusia_phi.AAC.8